MDSGGGGDEYGMLPVLRWAGGKRWLVPALPSMLRNARISNYHEPFLGGASVFLGVAPSGQAYLSDLNADLIETYKQIRDDADGVATYLRAHINSADHYYAVRDSAPHDAAERAARFIYLNHTSFNGIYRVNLKGVYNVPYGRRPAPNLPDKERLRAVSRRLDGAILESGDFEQCATHISEGDLVFLDPPYTVAHNNNGFIKYNQHLFSFEDQHRLSKLIDTIRERGAYYFMTNAAHISISNLFDKGDRRIVLSRRNTVGGTLASRGFATEYLFTNVTKNA